MAAGADYRGSRVLDLRHSVASRALALGEGLPNIRPASVTAGLKRPSATRISRAARSGNPPGGLPPASPPTSCRRLQSGYLRHVHASFASVAAAASRSPANRLLLRYFPIAIESDAGALVFVPQAAGFNLASPVDLVWRYDPPITWSPRILRASF